MSGRSGPTGASGSSREGLSGRGVDASRKEDAGGVRLGPYHQHRRARGRDAAPDAGLVLLEMPGLVFRPDYYALAPVQLPRRPGVAPVCVVCAGVMPTPK